MDLSPYTCRKEACIASTSPLLAWYIAAAALLIVIQASIIAMLVYRGRARRSVVVPLEERLGFETVLAELSAGLIHVPASGLDKALQQALGEVVTFLGADRGALHEHGDGGAGTVISWAAPGIEPLPWIMEAGQFPWTATRLRGNAIVRFSSTRELPVGAAIDRASYKRMGTRSHVSLPLHAGGHVLGTLSLDTVHDERVWSDEVVARLGLLNEAFASSLERRRMEVSIADRLVFEKLLSSLSAMFGNLLAIDFDRQMKAALRLIVDFMEADRGSLIEFSRDGAAYRTWTIDGGMTAAEIPWTADLLQRGHVVAFSRLDDLPEEAAVDRRTCMALGITSQVTVPLAVGGTVVGGLVLGIIRDVVAWQADEPMQRLHLLAEVLAHALARKQVELETQRLRQELAHIGRVSAMGELTASLAHELNQPLTAILNNAQVAQRLLAADVVDVPEMQEILKDIVEDDKRASGVIRRLRVLLTKGELEYVALDLNQVVTEVARLVMADAAIRNVPMRLEIAPGLPMVMGDRVQLQQVVLNLVLNGLDAMREPCTPEGSLVVRTLTDGTGLVGVAVEDAGPGVADDDAAYIFDALYTTKAAGMGMGLAISRTIVDAHGGRLTMANNATGGATFQFMLPADTAV